MSAPSASGDDRIGMLDTTRGVAVLGILLMNITGFGLPYSYDNPTVWGGESAADFAVWRFMALFFEGTVSFDTVSAVPEASTWAMMLLGFAGIGFITHRWKSRPASISA